MKKKIVIVGANMKTSTMASKLAESQESDIIMMEDIENVPNASRSFALDMEKTAKSIKRCAIALKEYQDQNKRVKRRNANPLIYRPFKI